ncbi:MAG: hypothetical protein U9M90_03515 [Patescibacteria group bacterium]|nr:hypothetical protein [Patescibacteria group bacterium]
MLKEIEAIEAKAEEYLDFLRLTEEQIECLNKEIEKQGVENRQDFLEAADNLIDLVNKTEKTIKENLFNLLKRAKGLVENKNISVNNNCSLYDVIGNSALIDLALVFGQTKRFIREQAGLDELNKRIEKLKNSIGKTFLYLVTSCNDPDILAKELAKENGYLENENFQEWFLSDPRTAQKLFPGGTKKIDFFLFFHEIRQGVIDENSLEERLDRLPDGFLDKEKILEDKKKFIDITKKPANK